MFTKIFYINLDRRPERNVHIQKELSKIGWKGPIERISAVDGRNLDEKTIKQYFTEQAIEQSKSKYDHFIPGYYMTRGGMGCALSHRSIFLKIMQENHDYVLVIEDDVIFADDFLKSWNHYTKSLPTNFDLIYVGYHESELTSFTNVNSVFSKPSGVVFGTFGMVINKKVVPTLINLFPVYGQIDSMISTLFPKINVYTLHSDKRLVVSQENSISDIQLTEQPNQQEQKIWNYWFILVIFFILIIFIMDE
jgi:GR25 family glycosyltransferase involved in LPS biosynthesis